MVHTKHTLQLADIVTIGCILIPLIGIYTLHEISFILLHITAYNHMLYAVLINIFALILYIAHYKSDPPHIIYTLFFGMSVITLIFAPFRDAWLGGIMGDIEFPIYGILFLISAPIYINAILRLCQKNIFIVPVILCTVTILRLILLIVFDITAVGNKDFESLSAYVLLIGILASVPWHTWTNTHIGLKILMGIGIITSIYPIIILENRTAQFALIFVSLATFIWLYMIQLWVKSEKYKHILYTITPTALLMGMTVMVLIVKISTNTPDGMFNTIWIRGSFIERIITSLSWSDIIFGNGWGQSYTHIQDSIWVNGIDVTTDNKVDGSKSEVVHGLGFSHSHNNIFESLLSMGILGFIFYCGLWIYLAWCLRHRMVVLAIFSGYATLNALWYHTTMDMILIILMISAICSHDSQIYRPCIRPFYTRIYQTINVGIIVVAIGFYTLIYIPYIQALQSQKIPESAFNDQWYNGSATGLNMEVKIWRRFLLDMGKIFKKGNMPNKWAVTKFVDIVDTLKNKSNNGNIYATKELLTAYEIIFYTPTHTHPILEAIRQREYEFWASAVLRANDQFNNRPELFTKYLSWHIDRDFHMAVMEVTKRLLAKNPDNAVAQYWRAMSLKLQGNTVEADQMFEQAFKNNVIRYQVVANDIYKKYKHLSNPIYLE